MCWQCNEVCSAAIQAALDFEFSNKSSLFVLLMSLWSVLGWLIGIVVFFLLGGGFGFL